MGKAVLDASALLAFLFQEPGVDAVAVHIPGSLISAVNYSEVIARALERGMPEHVIRVEFPRLPATVIPFDEELAFQAAALKASTRFLGLSLADRACLALGQMRNLPVITGDRNWLKLQLPVERILFR